MGCLPQAAWPERLLSEKSGRCGVLRRLRSVGAFTMIDRGDIRQAIDRCSNIWASLPGAGYGQFEHKADSLIAKFKEAGGTWSERLMYDRVNADTISWLSASSSACHGAVNHYRDNATIMPSKNAREPKLANAAITDMRMRQRDVAALDANTRRS